MAAIWVTLNILTTTPYWLSHNTLDQIKAVNLKSTLILAFYPNTLQMFEIIINLL